MAIVDEILGTKPAEVTPAPGAEGSTNEPGSEAGSDGNNNSNAGEGSESGQSSGAAPAPTVADLSDDDLLAQLRKRGVSVDSLSDIGKPAEQPVELTEEQKKEAKEKKSRDVLIYGLKTGKIKSEDQYKQFVADQAKSARQIAFENYSAERKAENPDLTDQEIEEDFKEENWEFSDENDKKRLRAAASMERDKKIYLERKYSDLLDLEADFDDHEVTVKSYSDYKKNISTIAAKVPDEIEFKIDDNMPAFKFKIPAETKKKIEGIYASTGNYDLFRENKLDNDGLQKTMLDSIKMESFDAIIKEVSEAYANHRLDQVTKGRKGIFERDGGQGSDVSGKKTPFFDQITSQQKV